MQVNPDFVEMLCILNAEGARYLLVGGFALTYHLHPRFTKDIDIWIEPNVDNAARVFRALKAFGAALFNLTVEDLAKPGTIFQIGVAPNRIDIITRIKGVEFHEAWPHRLESKYGAASVNVIGREHLIKNKRAVGRLQDLADVEKLEK